MADIIDVASSGQHRTQRDLHSAVSYAHVAYGLHALEPFTILLLAVVAMIVGWLRLGDLKPIS